MNESLNELFESVLGFVREGFPEEIDSAYEYFYEEDYPEDFLSGTSLDMAFINFEDWLICDHVMKDGKSFVDLYIEKDGGVEGESSAALRAMRESFISLYEAVSSDEGIKLRDVLLDEDVDIKGGLPDLSPGDIFAARIIALGQSGSVIGRCVYPFRPNIRENVLAYIDKQFNRYIKTKNPKGSMREFLKDESYIFNTIWINSLFKLG